MTASRRLFLQGAALQGAASLAHAATDRINVGVIGVGTMGSGHLRLLKRRTDSLGDVQVVAISDIYSKRKQQAREFLGLAEKDIHHEYEELLARKDVDAVFIAVPDHWHFRMAMDALKAGKDVYVQKPVTYTIEEAQHLAEAVAKSTRVLQVGSQYASELQYHKARELVAQGAIGQPLWAQGTYSRNTLHGEWNYPIDPEGTPANIDWKRFLGSAPQRPFSQDRFFRWRKYWDYSGGISTDLLYHRLVPFLVTLGPQFPVRVSANGGIYVHKDREVPDTISTTIEYPTFQITMSSSMAADAPTQYIPPVLFGHEGTLAFKGSELVLTQEPIFGKKETRIPVAVNELQNAHMANFLDCVRSRQKPNLDAEFGYQVMAAIGSGVQAYRECRQVTFAKNAPKRETYEGNGKNYEQA